MCMKGRSKEVTSSGALQRTARAVDNVSIFIELSWGWQHRQCAKRMRLFKEDNYQYR